jgi:membrane protease YdiL (CAAX protease family)
LLRYGPLPALGITSLLFAIIHLNPWGLLEIFAAGWLLGWLVLRSGSLWPAVLVHGLYNLTKVIMLVSILGEPPTPEAVLRMSAGVWGSPVMVVASGVVVIVLVLAFERRGTRLELWTPSS